MNDKEKKSIKDLNPLKELMDLNVKEKFKDIKEDIKELDIKDVKDAAAVKTKGMAKKTYRFFKNETKTMTAVLGVAVAAIIIVIGFFNVILPDKEFSEKENRVLAQMPKVSWNAIKEGTFASDVDSYVTDQFMARDLWIKVRSSAEVFLGKYQSNGVYKGDDGYLFEDAVKPSAEDTQAKIDAINSFAAAYPYTRMTLLMAPNSSNILEDKLPAYAPVYDQNPDMDSVYAGVTGDNITKVDVREAFRGAEEQIYYRTDHHWTNAGAYLAFRELCPSLWLDPDRHEYSRLVLTDDFSGTLSSKSGFSTEPDNIQTHIPANAADYMVSYVNEGKETASIFWPEKLKVNDKYTVFFGGNYAQVDIRTANPDRGKILIIKDSYANSMVPFLIPYYGKIVMIDPRYYNGDIDALMRQENFSQVLFLYNANTFFEDDSLVDVLAR